MKKGAILFAASKNRAYAIASVLMDIARLSPGLADEAVIIHNGITPNDQNILNSLYPCRFILYEFPISDLSLFSKTITKYFTVMVFAKFEAFHLLSKYRYIIALDYDILVQGDLSEVLRDSTSGFVTTTATVKLKDFFVKPVAGFDMNSKARIGSIWVLWDSIPDFDEVYRWCYETSEKIADSLYLPETGVISLALQTYNISPEQVLPAEEYDCHPSESHAEKAKILHCYGQPKFWNGFYSEQWEENYAEWLRLGGSPCHERALIFRFLTKSKRLIKRMLLKS